jgi:16S rRNA (cytidine1402-2'-O)-methyltransferase
VTSHPPAPGTLHVVATPIGNLSDITLRALEVLGGCPVIAAEDTRRLRVLAERHGFRPRRVIRCDQRREERAAAEILRALGAGLDVALTSDAGTPGVADPGSRVVRRVRRAGFRVVPVPGPSAPVGALSVSGLPGDRFLFAGFPPRGAVPLRRFLASLLRRSETILLLESPERTLPLLQALAEVAPDREVVLARELTKVHEQILTGTPLALIQALGGPSVRVRGEVVLAIAGADPEARGEASAAAERARALLGRPWAAKLTRRDMTDLLGVACGMDRNAAYRLVQRRTRPAGDEGDEGDEE